MTERTCGADDCDEKHEARGLCKRHYSAARYAEQRDRLKAVQAANRARNRQRDRARSRAWRAAHPDLVAAANRAYRRARGDVLREQRRAYRDANRDLIRAQNNRRKARERAVAVNDLSPAQWRQIVTDWGGRCAYCGCTPAVITMDHVVPLGRGGHHTAANVVPACGPCNSRKSDGLAPPFVDPPT